MSTQSHFSKLFEPARIGSLEVKNRIIMPAMGNRLCGLHGEVTDDQIEWYDARARGGVGLIIVESTHTATAIDPIKMNPRQMRADDDGFCTKLAELAEVVHDAGARVGIQLTPGFSSQARGGPWILGQQHVVEVQPVGPSAVTHPLTQRQARELTIEEIVKIVELCGWAAERVKQAGFDIIEIHAHSGFLLGQFLSPYFNRRVDRYGGTPERRLRFLLEIIESVRKQIGSDFPLIVKYSIDEFIEGGRNLKEGQAIARELEEVGINGIVVSSGIHGAKLPSVPSMYNAEGTFISLAEALKEVVSLPVILPGRLGNPILAETVLEDSKADFIAWGRPLIADPDLPRKVAQGRLEEIRWCISCNECMRVMWKKSPIRCTVNAVAGRERRYGTIKRPDKMKRVTVVGCGPAGMEAARVAALRGHNVVLYEKSTVLGGGQLSLASLPPHKDVLKNIVNYYSTIFSQLNNITVRLGKEVTAEEVLKDKPDAVIVATGAVPIIPDISGINKRIALTAFDVLSGKAETGETVVVAGGGTVGCEVANFLASRGKKVTIVEMLNVVAADVHEFVRGPLLSELYDRGVNILTNSRINAISENGVKVVEKNGNESILLADTVVLALGMKPTNELAKELAGKVNELHVIGDAKEPRQIRNSISDGYTVAYNI